MLTLKNFNSILILEKQIKELEGDDNMLTFYEMVGQRIIEKLNKLQWTQQTLANELNISKQVMSKIIKGEKKTTILEIKDIANILKVSVDELLQPINERVELIYKDPCTIKPQFMGRISTDDGRNGVNKAMNIIELIEQYEKDYEDTIKVRNEKVSFKGLKRKREFNPDL